MDDQRKSNKTLEVLEGDLRESVSEPQGVVSLNRSQEVTTLPTLRLLAYVSDNDEIVTSTMEFHMTIRQKVTDLSPKAASMLLSIANWRAIHQGVDFTLYLAMEFLYTALAKSGHDVLETRSDKIRKTLLVTDIVLNYIS